MCTVAVSLTDYTKSLSIRHCLFMLAIELKTNFEFSEKRTELATPHKQSQIEGLILYKISQLKIPKLTTNPTK